MDRLWRATLNSLNGLAFLLQTERAVRQECVVLAVAIPVAFWLTGSGVLRFMLIGSLVFVLVVELLNTAIEKLADRVTREQDVEIGRVKDIGSAAVGVAILLAAAVWMWMVIYRFYR